MENRMRKRMTVILNSKMNMRRFYVSAALLLTTLLAVAENNPYRSDVFWVTVPDHADWLYKTGEQANVEKLLADKNIQIDNLTSEISSNADKLKQLIAEAEAAEARRKEAEATAAAQAAAAAQASASSGTSSSSSSGNTSSNASATGTGSLTHPVPGAAITSGFGGRVAPTAGATTGHDGIDYGAGYGAAVYAADSGTVITAQYNSARGNYIVINNGMQTWYQHLSSMNVTVGQTVARGQVIGNVGTTGISTGPHLHFEVHVNGVPVNPLNYL